MYHTSSVYQGDHYSLDLRDPIFVMTLPFDQDLVKRYITEGILHHTRRRWEWFAEAQKLTPGLGTLGYLPFEVRVMILKELLRCRGTLSSDGIWEYDFTCGSIYDVRAYFFGFGRRGLPNVDGFREIRQVSSSAKAESDDVFLSGRSFRFNQASNLESFIQQLTPAASNRISSIDIGICTVRKYRIYNHSFRDSFLESGQNLRSKLSVLTTQSWLSLSIRYLF